MHAAERPTGTELREEFRRRNVAIAAAVHKFLGEGEPDPDRKISFMCECTLVECDGMLSLTLDEFGHVRSDNVWYAALPAHVDGDTDTPVSKRETYWIVRAGA